MKPSFTLKELIKPSFFRWMFLVGCDWAFITILLVTALWINKGVFYLLAMWGIGIFQHRISLMAHDGAHGCISRKRWLNDILTCLFAFWPLAIGLVGYRKFHFKHHHTVGTLADPELDHKGAVHDWDLPLTKGKLLKLTFLDLFGLNIKHMYFLIKLIRPNSVLDIVGPAFITAVFWTLVLYSKNYMVAVLWYGGLITTFWASFRWRIISEHVGTKSNEPTHRLIGSKLQKILFLPHNTDHHWEHHRWPSIPSWKLPVARTLVKSPRVNKFSQMLSELNFPSKNQDFHEKHEERLTVGSKGS